MKTKPHLFQRLSKAAEDGKGVLLFPEEVRQIAENFEMMRQIAILDKINQQPARGVKG